MLVLALIEKAEQSHDDIKNVPSVRGTRAVALLNQPRERGT
jgi:hypothetical protein